ncbi:MAG: GNAT family N-acetyltransferase [Microbacteriaceae bacterium]
MTPDLAAITASLRATGSVFAEDEAALLIAELPDAAALAAAIDRRRAGEPLEHVLGWAEFAGRRIAVGPGVFVPRRRSEFLAERALRVLRPGAVAVELCCGAAAIATVLAEAGTAGTGTAAGTTGTVAEPRTGTAGRTGTTSTAEIRAAEVWAADIDPRATAWAARNLRPDRVRTGDLYAALPADLAGRVDVLVANAPYLPSEQIAFMPVDAREHEPRAALDGGADGLDVHRRIAADAARWLRPGGRLLVEAGERQAERSAALFRTAGLTARIARDDDRDATVVEARRPAVTVHLERAGATGVASLLRAADDFGLALYGPSGYFGLAAERLDDPDVVFLVARTEGDDEGRHNGAAVGTVALVDRDDGSAELKRMFVAEAARGLGTGAALLEAAERAAAGRGIRLIELETGPKQPAAIALYTAHGYARVPLFPPYIGSTDSLCMAKRLPAGAPSLSGAPQPPPPLSGAPRPPAG